MAAGTDLVLHGPEAISTIIDLGDLGLDYVQERDGDIAIGAMTTLTDILEHPAVAAYLSGIVPAMLRQVGSPLLRNLATVGGNLVRKHPWSDIITVFRALGATIIWFDGQQQSGPLDDLYDEATDFSGSILTEVVLPRQPPGTAAAFHKFARSTVDIALLNCATMLQTEDGRCVRARVFVGGTPRLAERVPSAEAALVASGLSRPVIAAAAREAAGAVQTGDDLRGTAGYRTRLVAVGVTRCLEDIRRQLTEVAE
jgi:CO/xanthine dehydrogenase FAD-binding subunit